MITLGSPSRFSKFASAAAHAADKPVTFLIAVVIIIVWAATGPFFKFNDTWQLIINTGTTVVTFLMVFLIQNSQNRDSQATQIKLDEIIRSLQGAHNALLDLEQLEDEDLARIRADYCKLAAKARKSLEDGGIDTDTCEVTEQQVD